MAESTVNGGLTENVTVPTELLVALLAECEHRWVEEVPRPAAFDAVMKALGADWRQSDTDPLLVGVFGLAAELRAAAECDRAEQYAASARFHCVEARLIREHNTINVHELPAMKALEPSWT